MDSLATPPYTFRLALTHLESRPNRHTSKRSVSLRSRVPKNGESGQQRGQTR
jgi:hypothetical protein